MFKLRPYQQDAVDSLFRYFETKQGSPIISAPTGSGKSWIIAAFIKKVLDQWPAERLLVLTHVRELLLQDGEKITALLPQIPVGYYSAGLNKKETGCPITIASIQSVYKKAHEMGDISLIIIDESHLVSRNSESMYRAFWTGIKKFCPKVKAIGMTATPFRLDSGSLIKGEDRLFTDICYSISIKELIKQKYLSPLVTAPTESRIDTSQVKKRGGEFISADLQKAADKKDITKAALDEVEKLCADRKSWLVFCVGIEHAHNVCDAIRARGYSAEVLTGKTPKDERAQIINDFKAGKIRALVSIMVLSVGFDAPNADALICLRPTLSPGLWVQQIGRVMRLSPGKTDGLVLDFTDNSATHGHVDLITCNKDGTIKTAPYKECPECQTKQPPGKKICIKCGYEFQKECPFCHSLCDLNAEICENCGQAFPRMERIADHNTKAFNGKLISDDNDRAPEPVKIEDWIFRKHKKKGKPDSLRVTYYTYNLLKPTYNSWICFEHGGYAAKKANRWWICHDGKSPPPGTVAEALERKDELKRPELIHVKQEGKYWKVI